MIGRNKTYFDVAMQGAFDSYTYIDDHAEQRKACDNLLAVYWRSFVALLCQMPCCANGATQHLQFSLFMVSHCTWIEYEVVYPSHAMCPIGIFCQATQQYIRTTRLVRLSAVLETGKTLLQKKIEICMIVYFIIIGQCNRTKSNRNGKPPLLSFSPFSCSISNQRIVVPFHFSPKCFSESSLVMLLMN